MKQKMASVTIFILVFGFGALTFAAEKKGSSRMFKRDTKRIVWKLPVGHDA